MNNRFAALLPNDYVPFEREEFEGSNAVQRFERIVSAHPDRLALQGFSHSWTYRELDLASTHYARFVFDELGEGAEPVCLLYGPEEDIACAMQWAVLKAGKFYAHLDPRARRSTLEKFLRDLDTRLILCSSETEQLARELAGDSRDLTVVVAENVSPTPATPVTVEISSDSLAYIVYTSGSTGVPQGVMVSHRALLHFVMQQTNYMHMSRNDRVAQLSRLTTAASTGEIFPTILNGAALIRFPASSRSPRQLAGWMVDQRISVFTCVPAYLRLITDMLGDSEIIPTMRMLRLSGDRILKSDVDRYKRHFPDSCLLRVCLGSAEAFIFAHYFIDKQTEIESAMVPAGYALEDMQVSILDDNGSPLPANEIGEIALTSDYLSSGYWKDEELTDSKYLERPDGLRTYMTRDLGFIDEGGCIHIVGRKDARLKIYGKWISLIAVEEALLTVPGVSEVAVIPYEHAKFGTALAAFYVSEDGADIALTTVRSTVKDQVSAESFPKRWLRIDSMPLTANRKINRMELSRTLTEETADE